MDLYSVFKWSFILYTFFLIYSTLVIYITYRLISLIFPKIENKVFIENAPIVWSLKLDELIDIIKKNNK